MNTKKFLFLAACVVALVLGFYSFFDLFSYRYVPWKMWLGIGFVTSTIAIIFYHKSFPHLIGIGLVTGIISAVLLTLLMETQIPNAMPFIIPAFFAGVVGLMGAALPTIFGALDHI